MDGAVAHAEDPAVAGQQRRCRPRGRARPRGSRRRAGARCSRCAPPRRAAGRPACAGPWRPTAGRSCRRRRRRAGRGTAGRASGRDAGDAAGPVVEQRAGDVDALEQPGAGLLRVPGQDLVEVGPGADQAVARIAGQVRPVQLDPAAAADDAQALVAQPAVALGDRHAHAGQRLDRARGQAVAADLLPREAGLLQHQHVQAGRGQVIGDGEPAGPAPTTMTSAVSAAVALPAAAAGARRRRCARARSTDRLMLRGQVWRAGGGCLLGHGPVLICLVNLFTRAFVSQSSPGGVATAFRPPRAHGQTAQAERPRSVFYRCTAGALAADAAPHAGRRRRGSGCASSRRTSRPPRSAGQLVLGAARP